jgi:predicted O-linked N-acetylglucosamine transferase (SPINDLY family)
MTEIAEFYFRSNQYQLAKEVLIKLISSNEANSKSYEILAYIFGNEGNKNELYRLLSLACSFPNATAEAHYYFAKELNQSKKFNEGIKHLDQSIRIGGEFFEGCFELGFAYANLKNSKDAENYFKKALLLKPQSIDTKFNLAKLYAEEINNYQESIKLYDDILGKVSNHVASIFGLAEVYEKMNLPEKAIHFYKEAVKLSARSDDFWLGYIGILSKLGRIDEAFITLSETEKIYGNLPLFILIKGMIYLYKGRLEDAKNLFEKTIQADQTNHKAWLNKALVEFNQGDLNSALISTNKAIFYNQDYAFAWFYKGMIFLDKGHTQSSIECFETALSIDPKIPMLINNYISAKLSILDWGKVDTYLDKVFKSPTDFLDPTTLLYLCDKPEMILENNSRWTRSRYKKISSTYINPVQIDSKIKIAYLSADFRNHALTSLTRDLFKFHNRDKFEVFGFSIYSKEDDHVTSEIKAYFDHFIDITNLNDNEAVELIRKYDINIAVDLTGHTKHARTNIFLNRIAKTQINFIGYPNTMGNTAYDFIISDETIISKQTSVYFSEKIINISPCFQPNSVRKFKKKTFTRKDFNLPNDAFIYCCFNFNSKITKQILNLWMEILLETDNTYLWIYIEEQARLNFVNEVSNSGVNPDRIIFANRSSYDDYLSRFSLANLFLDTHPFGGGTTFSDALLSGIPILTLAGQSFHSRMGKSLLIALEVKELVTQSISEYKETAILLAKDKMFYNKIKEKLIRSLINKSIFDSADYTRNFEIAILNAHNSH